VAGNERCTFGGNCRSRGRTNKRIIGRHYTEKYYREEKEKGTSGCMNDIVCDVKISRSFFFLQR